MQFLFDTHKIGSIIATDLFWNSTSIYKLTAQTIKQVKSAIHLFSFLRATVTYTGPVYGNDRTNEGTLPNDAMIS